MKDFNSCNNLWKHLSNNNNNNNNPTLALSVVSFDTIIKTETDDLILYHNFILVVLFGLILWISHRYVVIDFSHLSTFILQKIRQNFIFQNYTKINSFHFISALTVILIGYLLFQNVIILFRSWIHYYIETIFLLVYWHSIGLFFRHQ